MPTQNFLAAVREHHVTYSWLCEQLPGIQWVPKAYEDLQGQMRTLSEELETLRDDVGELKEPWVTVNSEDVVADHLPAAAEPVQHRRQPASSSNQPDSEEQELQARIKALEEKIAAKECQMSQLHARDMGLSKTYDRYVTFTDHLEVLNHDLFGPGCILPGEFPEEAEKRKVLLDAEEALGAALQDVAHWTQVHAYLAKALESMQPVHERLTTAKAILTDKTPDGASGSARLAEVDLKGAQKLAVEVEKVVFKAHKLEPAVQHVGSISVPYRDPAQCDGGTIEAYHRSLITAAAASTTAITKLSQQVKAAKQVIDHNRRLVTTIPDQIISARKDLMKIRNTIVTKHYTGPAIRVPKGPSPYDSNSSDDDGPPYGSPMHDVKTVREKLPDGSWGPWRLSEVRDPVLVASLQRMAAREAAVKIPQSPHSRPGSPGLPPSSPRTMFGRAMWRQEQQGAGVCGRTGGAKPVGTD